MPPPTADLFRDAGWAAMDAFTATPGDHRTRLAAVIQAHLNELGFRGLLCATPPGEPAPSLEEDARWLAQQSGHPRFADGDGWCHLMDSEPDILMAYRNAMARRTGRPTAFRREQQVRDRLLRHVAGLGCNVGHDQ